MRFGIVFGLALCLIGCQGDKVDMSTVKSPDAPATPVQNLGTSKKPAQSPYKIVKGGEGTSVIVNGGK